MPKVSFTHSNPFRRTFEVLQTVIQRAHLSNVTCFRTALGAESGLRELVVPDMEGLAGTYWAHFAGPEDQGYREYVSVLQLDRVWKQKTIPRLDFMKCDVQGAELEVVPGGIQLLQAEHVGWLLEVSKKTSDEVFGLFYGLGYHAFVFEKKIVEVESYRDREFSNYFFLHPESVLWRRAFYSP